MSVDLNDPRLTAYALGELDDEAERLAVEAQLADDADALAFVEGIKQTAFLLSEELRKEPLPVIAPSLHKTIEHELCNDELPTTLPISAATGGRLRWIRLSLAAGIVAITGAGLFFVNQLKRDRTTDLLLAKADHPAPAAPAFDPRPKLAAPAAAPSPRGTAEVLVADSEEPVRRNRELPPAAPASPPALPKSGSRTEGLALSSPATAPAPPTMLSATTAPAPVAAGYIAAPPADPNILARSEGMSRKPAPASNAPGSPGGPAANMDAMSKQGRQEQNHAYYSMARAKGAGGSGEIKHKAVDDFAGAVAPAESKSRGLSAGGMGGAYRANAQPPSGGGALGVPALVAAPGPMAGRAGAPSPAKPAGHGEAGQVARLDELKDGAQRDFRVAGKKVSELEQLHEGLQSVDKSEKRLSDVPAQAGDNSPSKSPKSEAEALPEVKLGEAARPLPQIAPIVDNAFLPVVGNELSTFSIDVDTGAYSTVRRFLNQNQAPPKDAVRIEEMLNYFTYNDPGPKDDKPFAFNVEIAACPWNAENRLVRVGLKAKTIEADKRPPSNLVFLIDVSGSMSDINKLPLLKAGMKLLVDQLSENDRVAIVVYASDVRVHLPSTPCHRKKVIIDALETLQSGGSTAGGKGIELAYREAVANFIKGGTNRVILATDGDFNVGKTKEELLKESEERAKSGVFLTVLGFGEGNLQEAFMEQLADKGNGQYAYIDTIAEARKVLVHEMTGTLVTVAKDVKIQVEFNPAKVQSYRLIGYENRVMAAQDFRNDKKDAGEIGAGHGVTALYEITPVGAKETAKIASKSDRPLKYGNAAPDPKLVKTPAPAAVDSPESLTIFLRYKAPDGDKAKELEQGVVDKGQSYGQASNDFKFAAAVAGFGMLLRDSPYKGSLNFSAVSELATPASLEDKTGYRTEFVELVKKAQTILGQ